MSFIWFLLYRSVSTIHKICGWDHKSTVQGLTLTAENLFAILKSLWDVSLPNASTVEDAFRAVSVHMQTISIKYPSFVKVQSWNKPLFQL